MGKMSIAEYQTMKTGYEDGTSLVQSIVCFLRLTISLKKIVIIPLAAVKENNILLA
jgi:hypothetical protein